MTRSFGPWTTALGAGGSAGLSTFWKRRMAMLPCVNQNERRVTRRTALLLVFASIAACALPTLQIVPAIAQSEGAQTSEQKSTSRIFLTIFHKKDDKFESLIIAVDPESGRWQRLGDGAEVFHLRVSRDGQTLLFAKHEDGVWTRGVQEGSELVRVMYTGFRPIWSPDKKEIMSHDGKYEEGKGWKFSNWRIKADGKDLARLPIPETDGADDWSPDGKWVVTVSDRHPPQGSGYQLYVMRPDGSDERRITHSGLNVYARFSPDSRRIVYTHQEKGFNSLWVVNIDGTEAHEVLKEEGLTGVGGACWSPDGKQLVVNRYDWELDEKGRKFRRAGTDYDQHLEIIDADGKNGRKLRLEDLRPLDIGHPEWQ